MKPAALVAICIPFKSPDYATLFQFARPSPLAVLTRGGRFRQINQLYEADIASHWIIQDSRRKRLFKIAHKLRNVSRSPAPMFEGVVTENRWWGLNRGGRYSAGSCARAAPRCIQ